MSLEPGGRADKYGNEYENRFLARLLLQVVNQKLKSVIVEPLGEESDSVEFITEFPDGSRGYYQCKSSNGLLQSWSISSLSRLQIIQRSREIIQTHPNAYYYFISPFPYGELDELCKRANTNEAVEQFLTFQVADQRHKAVFAAFCRELHLDHTKSDEAREAMKLLSRSRYELVPYNEIALQDLEERISLTFTGDSSVVRVLLEQYANAQGIFGTRIIAHEIVTYLEKKGHLLRGDLNPTQALNRIQELNTTYWPPFAGINGQLMHRTATERIIEAMESNRTVVLCGKAGCGKSGCIQEVINHLKARGTLYLAIKLDRFVPSVSADQFGHDLGLEQSPVHALARLAAGKKCVFIMDQLDALRWTNRHSSTALDVCKEIARQVKAINRHQQGAITLVFIVRQFDLEHDQGLRMLFPADSPIIERIIIDAFSDMEVRTLIGKEYNALPIKIKRMLLTPSSLYVWTQLQPERRKHNIQSVYSLMTEWWKNIQDACEREGIQNAKECKDKIVQYMERNHSQSIIEGMLCDYHRVIQIFRSLGILRSGTEQIEFVHQSFLDFFISQADLDRIFCGENVIALLPPREKQYPYVRYRLLIVLQALLDCNQLLFVDQTKLILESDLVHYYIKCCVFDVIGQLTSPNEQVFALLDKYYERTTWKHYLDRVVFEGHPVFIRHLAEREVDWMEQHNLNLLRSIAILNPDFITSQLRPYAMNDFDDDKRIFSVLPNNLDDDSEDSFRFRLDLIRNRPELLSEKLFIIDYAIKHSSPRAIIILELFIQNWPSNKWLSPHTIIDSALDEYTEKHYKQIVERLFPAICNATQKYNPKWDYNSFQSDYDDWIEGSYSSTPYRSIVKLTKKAMSSMAINHGAAFCSILQSLAYPISGIGHEIIMFSIRALSLDYSDFVLSWLLDNFNLKVFVFSDHTNDYLEDAKKILIKYSPNCSRQLFVDLERRIQDWQDDRNVRIRRFRYRVDNNRNVNHFPDYHPNWGYFQKEMLTCLCPERLSKTSKELLVVMNRNEWLYTPYYRFGISSGPAKTVVSPIDGHASRLTDQDWIKIISNPNDRMRGWKLRDENELYYFESSHESFAASLASQAQREPERFAALSLRFPKDCYHGYIRNVIYALARLEGNLSEDSIQLYSKVLLCHCHSNNPSVCSAIVTAIKSHSESHWPDEILSLLSEYAINHPNPAPCEYMLTNSKDPQHRSVQALISNSLNCVRGEALHAIATLINHHPELIVRFSETITKACSDPHESVRYAALSCVIASYSFDKMTSFELMRGLIQRDLRLLIIPGIMHIISDTFEEYKTWYRSVICNAVQSEVDDLSNYAAGLLCAVVIILDDNNLLEYLLTHPFTEKERNSICSQAINLFSNDAFHTTSEMIIRHLVNENTSGLNSLTVCFSGIVFQFIEIVLFFIF